MEISWLFHCFPDCIFEVSQLTQITWKVFQEDQPRIIRKATKLVRILKKKNRIALCQDGCLIFKGNWILDASILENHDFTSQLEYMAFGGDKTVRVVLLSFKSYKATRMTRSVIAAEPSALSNLFDASFILRAKLKFLHFDQKSSIQFFLLTAKLFSI